MSQTLSLSKMGKKDNYMQKSKDPLHVIVTILLIFLLLTTVCEGQNTPERIELDNLKGSIRSLEKSIDNLSKDMDKNVSRIDQNLVRNVATIQDVYKLSIDAYDRAFARISWTITISTILITLILGVFSFFGIREYKAINRIRTNAEKFVKESMENYSTIEKSLLDLQKNFEADYLCFSAERYKDQTSSHRLALKNVTEAIEKQPTNKNVLARAYAYKGYILRELNRLDEAFAAVQVALEHVPDNPTYLYNLACYAALLGKRDEWIRGLTECVKIEPIFKHIAQDDSDFATVRDTSEFRSLTTDV